MSWVVGTTTVATVVGAFLLIGYALTTDDEDIHYLALNDYHEARGENDQSFFWPWIGRYAVTRVVATRVDRPDFPGTFREVILQKGRGTSQFSWTTDGRPDTPTDLQSWRWSKMLAAATMLSWRVLGEYLPDPTFGAVYYYNPRKATPCWALPETKTVDLLRHDFHRDIPWKQMKKVCGPAKSAPRPSKPTPPLPPHRPRSQEMARG